MCLKTCVLLCVKALRWCDEGAYLLASQMVDKFQTREGAQEALQYLSNHQERAPSALKNSQDILSFEFEAILTPQLQVHSYWTHKHTGDPQFIQFNLYFTVFPVPNFHGNREAALGAVHDQEQGAVSEEVGGCTGQTDSAGGPQAWTRPDLAALQVTPLLPETWYDPLQLPIISSHVLLH